MTDYITNWTKDELHAYILIYCAAADFIETEEEKAFLKEKANIPNYAILHKEFEKDNDFTRVQKILKTHEILKLKNETIDNLLEEIKDLFLSDGDYSILEQNVMRELKRLLVSSQV